MERRMRIPLAVTSLLLACFVVSGCRPSIETLGNDIDLAPTGPATQSDLDAAKLGAKAALPRLQIDVMEELGPSYVATVTVGSVGPNYADSGAAGSVEVLYVVEAALASDPTNSVSVNLRGHARKDGNGWNNLSAAAGTVIAVHGLQDGHREAMIRFLLQPRMRKGSIADVTVTPLSISWAVSGKSPSVRSDIDRIARVRGYSDADLLWISYYDGERDYPGSLYSELLHFERQSRTWEVVATRHGDSSSPVKEVR